MVGPGGELGAGGGAAATKVGAEMRMKIKEFGRRNRVTGEATLGHSRKGPDGRMGGSGVGASVGVERFSGFGFEIR
jgi:hypothetical protein